MLKQFKQLALETEGRYATESELDFIHVFIESAQNRIKTYEKIRNEEESLLDDIQATAIEIDAHAFYRDNQDMQAVGRRDRKFLLRHIAASLLIADIDRLRDGLLIWLSTIMKAQRVERLSSILCQAERRVLEQRLSTTEFETIKSALAVSQSLIG
ncbi:allophycocyanin [Lyngbya confervoides]|uniref:Allophycocyanin n=1 Tax=Lyngbya confervoides BDU141951 TaxID=1574623 RepID=A0ABD4T5L7_9CYAN|nr:allophycocyanin [Lyngbya confervoides]MCM1983824.1 allophycocyanin [Lyngbya confervoides BDU141951]